MAFFQIDEIIKTAGIVGVGGIVFAESGLLIGFFLPGDSLLFTAGFLASQGVLDIWTLALVAGGAAVLGDNVGYSLGKRVGKRLFTREDSRLFKKHYLVTAQDFYEKYGAKTIIMARFIPIVRTFAPVVAGMGDMKYTTFLVNNFIGGMLWAVGVTLLGFFLGRAFPAGDKFLLPVVILVIILSCIPTVWHILKEPQGRKVIKDSFHRAKNFRKK